MDLPLEAVERLLARRDRSEYARGVIYVVGAAISFGLLGTLSGLAFRAGMGSSTFTALRATVGAVLLASLILSGRLGSIDLARLSRRELLMLGAAVAANSVLNLALFAAYGAMTVALVLAVYFTYPLLVATVSVAIGRERFSLPRVFGLCLALVGLVLVVGSQAGPGARISVAGIGFAALAATCQATYLVVSRSGYTRVPSHQATALILGGGAILAWSVALVADTGSLVAWMGSPVAWAAVLVAGTLAAALAKVWLLRGVRRIGGTRTAVVMLGEPVTGVLAAALVLGQALTAVEVAGGLAILAAALLVQRPAPGPRARRSEPAARRPADSRTPGR